MLALMAKRSAKRRGAPSHSWRMRLADVPTDGPAEMIFEALLPASGRVLHWLIMRRRIANFCLRIPDREGLTNSLDDAARRLQHDAQEAGRLTELTSEQVAAVTRALRGNMQQARSGFWYTASTNLFFAFVGAGISELFRLYRRRRMSRRSRQAS
jgi:hypothetical protein